MMMYYIVSVLFSMPVWCPCMVIDVVSVQQYNDGLLPDIISIIIYLYLQPLIPPNKCFDIFAPLTGGCSE